MPTQSESPSLAEVIRIAIEAKLYGVHTCMPGQVVKYDATKQIADIQPVLKRKPLVGDPVALPVIPDVPVAFPRGGGAFMSFPIAAGDYVLLMFTERSIAKWLAQGGVVDPMDSRRHDLSDAVAYAGVYPSPRKLTNADASDLVIGLENGNAELHIKADGTVFIKSSLISLGSSAPANFAALAEKVLSELQKIQTAFNSHTHMYTDTGATPPLSTTMGPSSSYSAASVASTKVKVLA